MNKKIITAIAIAFIGINPATYANEDDHQERIKHYEAKHIETIDEAYETYETLDNKISDILKSGKELSGEELERIHEITYSLEAAVDKLRDAKASNPTRIDNLDEAVQALHFASEKHEEDKTRAWFAKLETAIANIHNHDDTDKDAIPDRDKTRYNIIIKDHKFTPDEIIIPAGKKVRLIIENKDATPEEFESFDLNREKIISGHGKGTIFIGPLKAGKYHFFGEFNKSAAQGYIIAK